MPVPLRSPSPSEDCPCWFQSWYGRGSTASFALREDHHGSSILRQLWYELLLLKGWLGPLPIRMPSLQKPGSIRHRAESDQLFAHRKLPRTGPRSTWLRDIPCGSAAFSVD